MGLAQKVLFFFSRSKGLFYECLFHLYVFTNMMCQLLFSLLNKLHSSHSMMSSNSALAFSAPVYSPLTPCLLAFIVHSAVLCGQNHGGNPSPLQPAPLLPPAAAPGQLLLCSPLCPLFFSPLAAALPQIGLNILSDETEVCEQAPEVGSYPHCKGDERQESVGPGGTQKSCIFANGKTESLAGSLAFPGGAGA